jgi:chemotaxis protein histidine kinase CheA
MTTKGKRAMEKTIDEGDIKGLEEEIDSAVDRLFVEKKRGMTESVRMESSVFEPPHETEKKIDRERSLHIPSEPHPLLESVEKMESQLLTLEWEITKENLGKTKEEVLVLRRMSGEKSDITSVLSLMENVLNHMIRNEENISPPMIKFLLDSKETIKLLMKKEASSEVNVYKQLAHLGIEARFSCLEGINDAQAKRLALNVSEQTKKGEGPTAAGKQIEELLNKMSLFSEKMDHIFKKIDQRLFNVEQASRGYSEKPIDTKALPVNVTVFKVNDRFFGVESDKVFKLFRVPNTFHDKYSNQERIRLKDFEVRLVDLKKIFSIENRDGGGETNILTVKENGGYKGLIIDQVLKKLSTPADIGKEYGDYFLGMIRWTYQEHPVEIPILDLKKF